MASYHPYSQHSYSHGKHNPFFFDDFPAQATYSAAYSSASTAYPYADNSASQDTGHYDDYSSSQETNFYDEYSSSQDASYYSGAASSQGSAFSSALPSPLLGTVPPHAQYGDYHGAAQSRAPFRSLDNYGYSAWNSIHDVLENAGNPLPAQDIYPASRATAPVPGPYITPPPSLMPTRDPSPAAYVPSASSSKANRGSTAYIAPSSSSKTNLGGSTAYIPGPSSSTAVPPREPSPTLYITPASSSAPTRAQPRPPAPRRTRASKGKRREVEDDSDDSDRDDDYNDEEDEEEEDEYEPGPKRRGKSTRAQRATHAPYDMKARKKKTSSKKRKADDPDHIKKPLNMYFHAQYDYQPVLLDPATYKLNGTHRNVFARIWYECPAEEVAAYQALAQETKANPPPPDAPRPRLPDNVSIETRYENGACGFELVAPARVLSALRHLVRVSVSKVFDEHVTPTRVVRKRITKESMENAHEYASARESVLRRWTRWCKKKGLATPTPPEPLFTAADLVGLDDETRMKALEFIPQAAPQVQTGAAAPVAQ